MKLIDNIDLALSLNKGKKELLFETLEELYIYYPEVGDEMLLALSIMDSDRSVMGFVKCHTFDPSQKDLDFIAVYKAELELGDFKVVFNDVRVYGGFLINVSSEADFRSKMMKIDLGTGEGFYKLNDF